MTQLISPTVPASSIAALPDRQIQLWSESFSGSSLPANWASSGSGTWTVSNSLSSPSGSTGYDKYIVFSRAYGLDKRKIRILFQILASGTKLGFAGFQAATGLGSGQGLVTVDSSTNTLIVNGLWTPGTTPSVLFSVPLGFTMATGHNYLLELEADHCLLTASMTDSVTGITASVSCGTNVVPPLTPTQFPAAFFCDYAGFVNIAGQFKILNFTTLGGSPNAPAPQAMFLGDSITFGVGLADPTRWTTLVGNQLPNAAFVASGRPGDNSIGALARVVGEMQYMLPKYLVLLTGTNDLAFMSDAASQAEISTIVAAAAGFGVSVILCCLPATTSPRTAFNANLLTLGLPVVRFDLATTVGNNGSTQDTSLFQSDLVHPNIAGAAAMAARFLIDAPQLFE